ncbi:M20 family peptidase [Piscinibacter sp. HJYY11]|uniref:M20 family peptidase n=1 Tax=Piscinibacter sp. HJYY11 TaxID=2801333 RepID=UPI001F2A4F28|nr:M20 family peptidase [Piscinibacter sp. HJYY11]
MKLYPIAAACALVASFAATLVVRAAWLGPRHAEPSSVAPVQIDAQAIARFAGSIRFRTIAQADDPNANAAEFKGFRDHLQASFPRLHASLRREIVADHALLYTWSGRDPSAKPVLWIAHQDVVPVSPGTEGQWQAAPFAGEVKDGHVWGRGTWDNKSHILAQMEAIEMLLAAGWQPQQTVYLAYGHDEEVTGLRGARTIAGLFRERGVRFDYALDEGLIISEGVIRGPQVPVALVGVAEKGYATVRLRLRTDSGHSSMPPPQTAIDRMAAAITRINREPLPARIDGVVAQMFEAIAPHSGALQRVLLSNLWLTGPLVSARLADTPLTNAMIRTTTAATMFHAGDKENVLPGVVEAVINARTLPGDTATAVSQRIASLVGDNAIEVSLDPGSAAPSTVSDTGLPSFARIERSIRDVFPDAIVAPGLVIGGTDSKHYWDLADSTYRFTPLRVTPADTTRFHGTDERVSVKGYHDMVRFYHRLLQAS